MLVVVELEGFWFAWNCLVNESYGVRVSFGYILELLDLLAYLVARISVEYFVKRFAKLLVVHFHSGFRVGRSELINR